MRKWADDDGSRGLVLYGLELTVYALLIVHRDTSIDGLLPPHQAGQAAAER